MRIGDILQYGISNIKSSPVRTLLLLTAMSIGVAAVVMLSSLGEAARLYVVNQFSALGTHLLIVIPGRSETTGGAPPLLGATPRDLTLEDALALERSPLVKAISPIIIGSAPLSHHSLEREVTVLGTNAEYASIRKLAIGRGRFLPQGDLTRGNTVCVIGETIRQELFGNKNPLGATVRINQYSYRIIGVLAESGHSIGLDLDDVVFIPVAWAQTLFNTSSLFRILIQSVSREHILDTKQQAIRILRERHEGEDDVTVITQDAVLATFDQILKALTYTVAGIAAISLAVAGILIMNVMLVSVSQRTPEIGLLKALGANRFQVLLLFLTEAALLSLIGALCGLVIAWFGIVALDQAFPKFPLITPPWAYVGAVSIALFTGLLFGILPARRGARLDPVHALTGR